MADNQILFCQMLENYFHVCQRNVKVDCIFNNLRAAACKDREFAVNDQILRIELILPKNPHW